MPDALTGFLLRIVAASAIAWSGSQASPARAGPVQATGRPAIESIQTLPGREADARVATVAFRLAVAGLSRCSAPAPSFGLVLQHLSQFAAVDRPGMITALPIDRGPGVIVVLPDGPAAAAGIRPADVLLGIDGRLLPPEDTAAPFDAARAHARADAIDDLLDAGPAPRTLSVLRDGVAVSVTIAPRAACPSRVRLARSDQRNAYADGRHVFLTTGLVSRLRNDNELAFVVAHEMAHNILGHAAIMRGDGVKRGLGRTLGASGRIVRETERAADALAGELMLDAGFDPVTGAAMLERLGTDLGIGLFAAHDPAGRRIAAMRALRVARTAPSLPRIP